MKIEILYPEIANLFGEVGHIDYLKLLFKGEEVIETSFSEEPVFAKEKVDMIFLGSMSENNQKLVLEKLLPYKERIKELIEEEVCFLVTGNALEIFCQNIKEETGSIISAMGIFPFAVKQDFFDRHNSLFLGSYEDIEIVGFKSQFTTLYGDNDPTGLFQVIRGSGMSPGAKTEGIRHKNFFATYLQGPLLLMNPPFTRKLLQILGKEKLEIPFEKELLDAYKVRVEEHKDEKNHA